MANELVTRAEVRSLRLGIEAMWYTLLDMEERLPNPDALPQAGTLPAISDAHVEQVLEDEGYTPRAKHYAKPRDGAGRGARVNINGPVRGDIHERIMDELAAILTKNGGAMTSRELQAKSPLVQRRYRDVDHRVAAVTTHMRNFGADWDIVEAKHPSGQRLALAWYFKKGKA